MGVDKKLGVLALDIFPAIARVICETERLVAEITKIVFRFRNTIADRDIKKAPCPMPKMPVN
jgi:hypothetical protein